jgi:hypothetical protein
MDEWWNQLSHGDKAWLKIAGYLVVIVALGNVLANIVAAVWRAVWGCGREEDRAPQPEDPNPTEPVQEPPRGA